MSTNKKYNIILDLDNTLLSAIPLEDFDWDKKTKQKALEFNIHHMEEYYIIFERPGLQEFLDFLFKNFNVSIWSAASKDYVLYIIEHIILKGISSRKLDYIFFSYHCNWSKKECKELKCLDMLYSTFKLNEKFKKYNTILIDDLPQNCKNQLCNTIQVHPFEFDNKNSEQDNELFKVMDRLNNLLNIQGNEDIDLCLTKRI
jgi:TFIIF-interacting CTD phosphatase-like protein